MILEPKFNNFSISTISKKEVLAKREGYGGIYRLGFAEARHDTETLHYYCTSSVQMVSSSNHTVLQTS